MIWHAYWLWFAIALALGILEVLAPGFILLGFAIAAAVIGTIFLFGGPLAAFFAGSLPLTLVLLAAMALVSWLVMRRIFKTPGASVKTFDHDINDV